MKTVQFGATGVMVSELCLGTMMFADRCDYAASEAIVNAALAHGINFVDTAAMYTRGRVRGVPRQNPEGQAPAGLPGDEGRQGD